MSLIVSSNDIIDEFLISFFAPEFSISLINKSGSFLVASTQVSLSFSREMTRLLIPLEESDSLSSNSRIAGIF